MRGFAVTMQNWHILLFYLFQGMGFHFGIKIGKDMHWKQRIYCGDVSDRDVGKNVQLTGWVDALRDHGHLLFIHLRDISGIVQVVFDPQHHASVYGDAARLKEEFTVEIAGKVCLREKGTENPHLETGRLEVFAERLLILSPSKVLPFQISEKAMEFGEEAAYHPEKVDEELRLRYRYLDLRRPSMQQLLIKRYEIIKCIREYLDEQRFIEVETPVLTQSTPEGARDYLVPSRVHQGKFYALPQSPQLFKQILMISGMDRYFQVARCFRDEDLRPNRQPEFTQLDLEASFIDEEFIYMLTEEMIVRMFAKGGTQLNKPFPRLTYHKAMSRYGTDRPDLRFDMSFKDVTDLLKHTSYDVFRKIIAKGGIIKGFCVKGQARTLSKNVLQNDYAMKIVPRFGGKGLTWMKVETGRLQSNIVQFFSPVEQTGLIQRFQAVDGDVLMMIADTAAAQVHKVLGRLRLYVAEDLGMIPIDVYCPVWITAFPLFEQKDGEIRSQHHAFTMPDRTDFVPTDLQELGQLHSRAYDIVINGEEVGGGSLRIHTMALQKKIFQALGLTLEQAEEKFGFFLDALEYGAPPHGGLALGLDRIIAMILNTPSIRDVIAFPKNRRAVCPLTRAPSHADPEQLNELGLIPSQGQEKQVDKDTETADGGKAGQDQERHHEKISKQEVAHVAGLARLRLPDQEVAQYQQDLNTILEYVAALDELDTEGVTPMNHVLGLKNIWREDKPMKNKETEPLLANAPIRNKHYYMVPKILEG